MAATGDAAKQRPNGDYEQPGLERAGPGTGYYGALSSDGVEVVSSHGIEVVPGSSPPWERRSSLNGPEAWQYSDVHQQQQHQMQPLMQQQEKQAVGVVQERDGDTTPAASKWTRRRCCGMRVLWWGVLLVVILLVIVGTLGGYFGTIKGPGSSSSSHGEGQNSNAAGANNNADGGSSGSDSQAEADPKTAMSQSGVAATFVGSGNDLYTYYQDTSNRIIESVYADGDWSSSEPSVIANATAGSPLAVVSYDEGGSTWREVFFVADDRTLWSTRAATEGSWGDPGPLVTDTSDDGYGDYTWSNTVAEGPALTVCFGTVENSLGVESFKLYYGSTLGYIQEMGRVLDNSTWFPHQQFNHSDPSSGVGCSFFSDLKSNANTELGAIINVYYRNTSSLALQQTWWSFTDLSSWYIGPSSAGISIGTGTAISVTSDGGKEEYVFFQSTNGTVTRGTIDATSFAFGTFSDLETAVSGGRLASAYSQADSSTVYMFQNSTEDTTVWLSSWDLDGNLVKSQPVPGSGEAD